MWNFRTLIARTIYHLLFYVRLNTNMNVDLNSKAQSLTVMYPYMVGKPLLPSECTRYCSLVVGSDIGYIWVSE